MRICTKSIVSFILVAAVVFPLNAQSFLSDRAVNGNQAGFGLTVATAGGDIMVGEPANTYASGHVYVYRKSGSEWTEAQRLAASDATDSDGFGLYVDADTDRMIVTARPNGSAGKVYIFERSNGGDWMEAAHLAVSDMEVSDMFAAYARIDGDYAMVGAEGVDSTGAVIVFHRDGNGTWSEHSRLKADDGQPGDRFGWTFDLDDGKALVSATGRDSLRGAVYAFELDDAGRWQQHSIIAPETLAQGDQLAFNLVMRGGHALLGSLYEDGERGAVIPLVFNADENAWIPMQKIVGFDRVEQSRFGRNVALYPGGFLVGAPGSNAFQGSVHAVSFDPAKGFTGVQVIYPDGLQSGDYFGGYIAAEGDLAVVGMRGSGAARVLEQDASGKWAITATLESATHDGLDMVAGEMVTCNNGTADVFDCGDVDLASFMPVSSMGGDPGIQVNDVWGWEYDNREFALVGRQDGTAFVDITNPSMPVYLGELPKTASSPPSVWRDIKVYKDHAFITADGAAQHGMQIFDLKQIAEVHGDPVTFEETAHYAGIGSAHNIVINEDTGYAYAVGVNSGGETCGGGLHMINIQNPTQPTFAGCFSDTATGRNNTGYSHDAQCIIYNGPDTTYSGKEICFGSNETALSIADVSDKSNPVALSNTSYPNVGYSHQGWVTEDHRYFFMNDELDELGSPEAVHHTRTLIFDITDLDDPILLKEHFGTQKSSDHNLYIKGNLMYQANYKSGLRILDISDVANPVEVGYFDTVPIGDNSASMGGAWSNYPYFSSGNVIVTSGMEGLFVVRAKENLIP